MIKSIFSRLKGKKNTVFKNDYNTKIKIIRENIQSRIDIRICILITYNID